MNAWLWTGIIASGCLIPLADMCLRGTPERRLAGLEIASPVFVLILVLLVVGEGRLPLMDLPLSLAVISFGGGLVFARFLEKHL